MTKTCKKRGHVYDSEENARSRLGRCPECTRINSRTRDQSEYLRAWRARHPEKVKEYVDKYRATEKYKETRRVWNQANQYYVIQWRTLWQARKHLKEVKERAELLSQG